MENKQMPVEKHPARKFTPEQIAEAEKAVEEIERGKIIPAIANELELMRLEVLKKYGVAGADTGMLDIKKESEVWNKIKADPAYKKIEEFQELQNKNPEAFVKQGKLVLKAWLRKQGVELKRLDGVMKKDKHSAKGEIFSHLTTNLRKLNNIMQEVKGLGVRDKVKNGDWEGFQDGYQKAVMSMWRLIEQNDFYKTRVKPVRNLRARMKNVRELINS